jgi:hypothetical protein
MPPDLESIKNVAPILTPFITALIDTWIKPKLSRLIQTRDTDRALLEHAVTNRFKDYLIKTCERYTYISVLAFQNQPRQLEEIYLPLKVRSTKVGRPIKIDRYEERLIPAHKKILLTDTAGMGKSTILKYLLLRCVKENKGIPVFIELRKLVNNKNVLGYVYNALKPLGDEYDRDFILTLIERGDFIFFLDGYDEIPFKHRDSITYNLQDFPHL